MALIAPALHSPDNFSSSTFPIFYSGSVCVSPVSKEHGLNLLKAW